MLRRADIGIALSAVALLLPTGCGGAGEGSPANVVATPVTGTPAPLPTVTPTAATPVARVALPAAITVTTNEPFLAAAIEGDAIRFSGVDRPERGMAVVAREDVADGRRWTARDAAGVVAVTVTTRRCTDDMSGEARAFSGTIAIDGQAGVRGCAFPTPDDRIPARFVGRWDRDAAACARPATSIEGVTIGPRELRFHESLGAVATVVPAGDGVAIVAAYEGEGERWTARQRLTIDGDRLTIAGEGAPISRMRCPLAAR